MAASKETAEELCEECETTTNLALRTSAIKLNLSRTAMDRACALYQIVKKNPCPILEEKLSRRSRLRETQMASVLLIASQQEGRTITIKRTAAAFSISKKELMRGHRIMMQYYQFRKKHDTTKAYISSICGQLNLSAKIKSKAKELANTMMTQGLMGTSPQSRAAIAVYRASMDSHNPKTIKQISDITSIGTAWLQELMTLNNM